MHTNALGAWLTAQMKERRMSANQFAAHVGVAVATITKMVNGEHKEPSLPFLRKLATYTHTPLTVLIALAYPDAADELATMSPDDQALVVMWHNLDPMLRKAVIAIMHAK